MPSSAVLSRVVQCRAVKISAELRLLLLAGIGRHFPNLCQIYGSHIAPSELCGDGVVSGGGWW